MATTRRDDILPYDDGELETDDVWWPACTWPPWKPTMTDNTAVTTGSEAESPIPGVQFDEYLANMGITERKSDVTQDCGEVARGLLSRSFRAKATRENVAALAGVLEDWSERPNMSVHRLTNGWSIFMNDAGDAWGMFITPRNAADMFENFLRRETTKS